ncbi:MAG: outer membrane lipoprotein carrier protein LolA, partial [Bergeyella zoohelcum]|nr:outer membrane lipoprotein carrier protein LolA [Bergeyella zoohelcum]
MNYITKISTAVLSFGVVALAFAQKSDVKSKSILDAVSAKYKSNKNTYFKFAYSTGSNGKIFKTQTGIFYTTPTQYKLKIMGIEQIFDGQKVYNINDEDQEVTIAKANGNEMMFSPTNYLNSYKKDYNTEYVGKKSSADVVKLTPI